MTIEHEAGATMRYNGPQLRNEDQLMRTAIPRLLVGLLCVAGCAGSSVGPDGSVGPDPPHVPGMSGLGAHALTYYELGANGSSSITTPVMATQATGSTLIVGVGRGKKALFAAPTDNKGNSGYQLMESVHPYTNSYPDSGTALYTLTNAKGGAGFQVSNSTSEQDEITLAVVEIIEGSKIVDSSWRLADTADKLTSDPVTTTGPATLVAFWWGTGDQYDENIGVPGDGFQRIDYVGKEASLVQCSVAVKNVTAAGTYSVSWTAARTQGAQLYLVAVQ